MPTSTPRDHDHEYSPAESRPLTAPEWHGLLANSNYILHVHDETTDETWYFWCEQHHEGGSTGWLYAHHDQWEDADEVGTTTLQDALAGDVSLQLCTPTQAPDHESPSP